MPLWFIKTMIVLVFGLPLLIGLTALLFGDIWLEYMDKKEDGHEQSECDGR